MRQLDSCVLAAPMLCQLSVKSAKPLLNKTVVKPLLLPTNVIDFLADRAVSSQAGETLWVSWDFITELSAGSTLSLSLNVWKLGLFRYLYQCWKCLRCCLNDGIGSGKEGCSKCDVS